MTSASSEAWVTLLAAQCWNQTTKQTNNYANIEHIQILFVGLHSVEICGWRNILAQHLFKTMIGIAFQNSKLPNFMCTYASIQLICRSQKNSRNWSASTNPHIYSFWQLKVYGLNSSLKVLMPAFARLRSSSPWKMVTFRACASQMSKTAINIF